MVNVTYRSIFWRIRMYVISEPLPMSKGDTSKSMYLTWHAKGTCNSNCPLSRDHVAYKYKPAEYVQFKAWCEQHFNPKLGVGVGVGNDILHQNNVGPIPCLPVPVGNMSEPLIHTLLPPKLSQPSSPSIQINRPPPLTICQQRSVPHHLLPRVRPVSEPPSKLPTVCWKI